MISKKFIAAGLALLPLSSVALASGPAITVVSRGHDIRLILTDIFAQAKKSCIIQPNLHMSLYLSLENTDFDQALAIICKHAGLESTIQDGVYYIRKPKDEPAQPAVDSKTGITPLPAVKSSSTPVQVEVIPTAHGHQTIESHKALATPVQVEVAPTARNYQGDSRKSLTTPIQAECAPNTTLLKKRIKTHLSKADIRAVFTAFSEQSGAKIQLDPTVPAYKLDAYLNNTSLKYALDTITKMAKLTYRFTDPTSITISLPKS